MVIAGASKVIVLQKPPKELLEKHFLFLAQEFPMFKKLERIIPNAELLLPNTTPFNTATLKVTTTQHKNLRITEMLIRNNHLFEE